MNLEKIFIETLQKYTSNKNIIETFYNEIAVNYNSKTRFYHNFTHIKNMIEFALSIKEKIVDFDTFILAIFYHDVIYNSHKSNNEEESTKLAKKHLSSINFNIYKIDIISEMILRSKNHSESKPNDSNELKLFLDIDLLILASPKDIYKQYVSNIKQEYKHVPKIIFNSKRKQILKNIYSEKFIYKTSLFRNKYENLAKNNLLSEINSK